jgi:hypothetical protein
MKTQTPALALLALSATLYGCQQRSTENAPITTTSPAGESTAPSSAAAERRDDALVRFVNAMPSKAVVDLYADDNRTFDGVSFRTVTPYREVDGQYYTFRLRPAGSSEGSPLASNSEGLDDGDYYTVFAVPGDRGAAMLRVVEDDFSAPADGKARVRVVHASGDIGELALFERGRDTSLFNGVDFQTVTDYDEVDAWQGALDIKPQGGESVLTTIPDATFEAGKVYTVVVVGNSRTTPKIEAFVIEDRIGVPGPQASARLDR